MFGLSKKEKLRHAVVNGESAEKIRRLADGAKPGVLNHALVFGARDSKDNAEGVAALIKCGADVNAHAQGLTPLVMAAANNNLQIIEILMEHKADPDLETGKMPPLWYAAKKGHRAAAQLLLDHGADITAASSNGSTPLTIAAEFGHFHVMELLCERGARLDEDLKIGEINGWVKAVRNLARLRSERHGAQGTEQADGYFRQNDHTILHRETLAEKGLGLTKLFNFEAREVVTITERNGMPSSFVRNFTDIENQDTIKKAYEALREQGGDPPDWRAGGDKPKTSVKIG